MNLLPMPRAIVMGEGYHDLVEGKLIALDSAAVRALRFTASGFQAKLKNEVGIGWQIAAGWAIPKAEMGLVLLIDPVKVPHSGGYQLSITPGGIQIVGNDAAGVFYGTCTLNQLIEQVPDHRLACMEVFDWPDFAARGVMLDISRDKVYRMETLYELIDRLAGWKVNQVQLYTEHTFAYHNHPEVWAKASPLTGEEILALDAFCRERFIELVPNQNLFGHMERWLRHPRYAPLAEIHGEFPVPWGTMRGPFSLAPTNPESLNLARSLLDELLPHFSSRMVNIGCDETFDVGQGQSKAAVEALGEGRVYLDYLLKLYADVSRRGCRTQFWGDIINQHPELVAELPRDMIGLLWGYEAEFPFAEQGERFARAGVPYYMCPGTSSWNSIGGRTKNALGNLLSAAENGLKFGACGYLNTDWGDNGHWQVLPISLLGFAAGAAYSWCLEVNRDVDIASALSWHGFEDRSGTMGRLAYDLGNAHLATGFTLHNATVFHRLMVRSLRELPMLRGVENYNVNEARGVLEACEGLLSAEKMKRTDAPLVHREFTNTLRLLRHACDRWEVAFGKADAGVGETLKEDMAAFLEEYRAIWLERNRPGGLDDSMARFETARKDAGLA